MDAKTMLLWVVLALVVGAPMTVAPIRPVAVTALNRTLPGIDLVTGTNSLIASLSARSNRDVARKVLSKARCGRIIFLSRGHMLCHPVTVARRFADSELFLSNFNRVPPQTDLKQAQKGHAAFVKMFPVFQQATSLITYCYELVAGRHHHFGTKTVRWVILWLPVGLQRCVMMLARILIWVSIASRIFAKPASRIDASFSW